MDELRRLKKQRRTFRRGYKRWLCIASNDYDNEGVWYQAEWYLNCLCKIEEDLFSLNKQRIQKEDSL